MTETKPSVILRRPEVMRRTGLSKTGIWLKEKAGTFPQRVVLGPNSVGWREDEVEAWITARERAAAAPRSPAAE